MSSVNAVTGPGIPLPTAVQVEFAKANMATFAAVPSDNAMEPDAKSRS